MENPYQSPTELDSLVRVVRFPKTSRLRFLYVVAMILSLALAVTVFVVQKSSLSYLGGFTFFGLTASGPLITLAYFVWGIGPWAVPIWSVSILVFVTTLIYLFKPNSFTFVVSLLGAVAWVSIPVILIVILPELHIRL